MAEPPFQAFGLLLPRQNTVAELAAFEATCERLAGFDSQLWFEAVDGFLTAVAAGPRRADAAEWLPALCGGDDTFERVFADPEDHAQALNALQARLKALHAQLDAAALLDDPDAMRLSPLIAETLDAEHAQDGAAQGLSDAEIAQSQPGAAWALNLMRGVESLPDLWRRPDDEQAAALFQQAFDHIAALLPAQTSEAWRDHLANYYPDTEAPTRDELIAEACMAVQDLRRYWVDFAPRPETRRVAPRPGRNDPCSCGSGRKFKKCHGS